MKTSDLYKPLPVDTVQAYNPSQRTYHHRVEEDGLVHLYHVTCIICRGSEIVRAIYVYGDPTKLISKGGDATSDLIAAPWHPSEDEARFDKIFGEEQWVFDEIARQANQNFTYRPTY